MEKSFVFNTQSKQCINIFNSSDAIVQYSHKNKNRMRFLPSSKQLRNRKTQNTSLTMDGKKRRFQTQKRTQRQRQFRPRFHQPQPQPQPQTQVQTQGQPQPQPQTQTQTQVQGQAQEQNGNNYITRRDLEEVLNKFKNELKNEIKQLKNDFSMKLGNVYEASLRLQLPSLIQEHWNLSPVYPGSARLYRKNKMNENSFNQLQTNLCKRPKLGSLIGKKLNGIEEVEINFFQPYVQQNNALKPINLSPTKQNPLVFTPINTLVIAEATVSTLGFHIEGGSRANLLFKLAQLEIQIEFLKVHYKITEIDQFRVLLVSPSLKGVEWTTKLNELLKKHDKTFENLYELFEKDFFIMIGI